ncbi:tRNA (adenosine(37)-N6)-threonylcarbamoyltransferase complex transferase subunit TsaD [soil metagenome]
MKILAIETSCDETAVAVIEASGGLQKPTFKILGNSLISQIDIHKEFGGVVPMLAKREHKKNLPILLEKTLLDAGLDPQKPSIDALAVTSGPGLEPALWEGILFTEELGQKWDMPVFPINHMEGHVYSPLYEALPLLTFPALALLVSGGHTELVYIKDFGSYEIIGRTLDDAAGEAFDKVARLLGLEYPGGPKVSLLAASHRKKGLKPDFEFPRPMIHSKDLNFSYSGLKTAVLYKLKDQVITPEVQEETARAFEDAAIEVLIEKTKKALEMYDVRTLIVAGGVSQNTYLRSELQKLADTRMDLTLLLPIKSLTTDNAVMIGIAAYIQMEKGNKGTREKIRANGNLKLGA